VSRSPALAGPVQTRALLRATRYRGSITSETCLWRRVSGEESLEKSLWRGCMGPPPRGPLGPLPRGFQAIVGDRVKRSQSSPPGQMSPTIGSAHSAIDMPRPSA
jgi:hypothetical protein